MSESLSLYKLIILYMLENVNFPLTNNHLINFIVGQGYTDYFHVQQAIAELVEADLITVETLRNTTQYEIAPQGSETLSYFSSQISDGIVADIQDYLKKNSYELRNEVSHQADYSRIEGMEYEVHCRVKEGKNYLMDLRLLVPSEDTAKRACDNWPEVSQDIYKTLIAKLGKKE